MSSSASYLNSPAETAIQYMIPDKHGKRFSQEEDNLLRDLAKDKKNRTWKEIALFLPGRTACQCRDRYNQYLFKDVVNKPWTPEEDEIIVKKYKLYGPHWVKISQYLPGRSGNNIKNRWNSALTKYHGMSHKNPKIIRRSNKSKFIDDNIIYNTNQPSSPEIHVNEKYSQQITPKSNPVINEQISGHSLDALMQVFNQNEDAFQGLFDDFNEFSEFENFAF
ncbi:Myb-like DNA-binding domain containing protein [Trichomonas vaginalis G3]|uniref:Myb-like DNA-binding domain containing protein n=1 Tax=Trichomonas vaginalis (strain ATCC PRA-98 / G3) TaxID=412133 RepID=A2FKT8_TRIV3|nr:RNA polymerase II transcription regulator recruiting protein [Trichomonas vaginalis G3]EAX94476.1 Myb-like DNA-binding domain containing protein [Trichomonas vaginalis G3]KAI5504307.1 RNA polymerase II transcription regulator recruiting protein [Trichomonas vaginalis G3]|eukprot:XP_001307406.1 Myb-like DNA-binding domain containing protein [Trichomonas vaginalis G3]